MTRFHLVSQQLFFLTVYHINDKSSVKHTAAVLMQTLDSKPQNATQLYDEGLLVMHMMGSIS